MMRLFNALWDTILKVLSPWIGPRRINTIYVEELPDSLQERRLYVIGGSNPWFAALVCPCGCTEIIQISLLPNDLPRWNLKIDHNGLPTLWPSVWRTKGCRSHFFLRDGLILWCPSGTTPQSDCSTS